MIDENFKNNDKSMTQLALKLGFEEGKHMDFFIWISMDLRQEKMFWGIHDYYKKICMDFYGPKERKKNWKYMTATN